MKQSCILFALAVLSGIACNTLEKAAKDDPMKCERDPKCDKKNTKSADCSTQCNDDPACMDRCEQFRQGSGANTLGH